MTSSCPIPLLRSLLLDGPGFSNVTKLAQIQSENGWRQRLAGGGEVDAAHADAAERRRR
jgi:hypothetical protein